MKQLRLGFTLVEMMIVVVIIGILTLIAMPSYSSFIARTRRTDAKAMLQQVTMWMERNQAATYTYATDINGVTVDNAKLALLGFNVSPAIGTTMYTISFVSGPTASTYVLVATPTASQFKADSACPTLGIDNTGQRGFISGTAVVASAASDQCWQ